MAWTATIPEDCVIAPDGSEVRPLLEVGCGGMSLCSLAPGGVSRAVRHRTIEELWFFAGGRGEVWRRLDEREEVVAVAPGVCLAIPAGAHFQFRNTGNEPLVFVIATMPPWPGEQEAVRVRDHWPAG